MGGLEIAVAGARHRGCQSPIAVDHYADMQPSCECLLVDVLVCMG